MKGRTMTLRRMRKRIQRRIGYNNAWVWNALETALANADDDGIVYEWER